MGDGTQLARAMFDRDLRASGRVPVLAKIDPRLGERAAYLAANLTRAGEAVADDPARIAADPPASDTDTHREDGAAMEHERQRRLARWQTIK